MTIKYSKEVSDFIEQSANAIDGKWFWFPFYFKKVGEGLFELIEFKDTESGLTHIVERSEPKEELDEEKELFESFAYIKIHDLMFGVWLGENGWQRYDCDERWINLKAGNAVADIKDLVADYKKENQEP